MQFQHILVPVDFSAHTAGVLLRARAMAQTFRSRVSLLHVIHRPISALPIGYIPDWDPKAVEGLARTLLDELSGFEPVPVSRFVDFGDPATVILEFADRNSVDVIMMPTRGRGTFRSLLLGSVIAKVLHDAKCPVWSSTHRDEASDSEQADVRRILCAIDLVPESVRLIAQASGLAAAFRADLTILHAIPALRPGVFSKEREDFPAVLRENAYRQLAKLLQDAHASAETVIAAGEVSHAVRETATGKEVDLVVIGRGDLPQGLGRLRSNVYAIIRDSPCPVMSF